MNTAPTINFAPRAELSLKRRVRDQEPTQDDFEALRVCEENLRAYEARLRAFQAELEAAGAFVMPIGTNSPFGERFDRAIAPQAKSDESMQAGWDKIYRARSLMEAEQAVLKDERVKQRETAADLERREQAVGEREARMAEWEQQAATAAAVPEPSAVARLTRAPWQMARTVFSSHK